MSERIISHYRILGQIGKGGMGEVYAAEDELLRRKVALKSIRSEVRIDAELRARFLREARVLSQLDHTNICRIFDYISTSEGDYIVLELIDGVDLGTVIAAGIEQKRALRIALEISDVLAAAHAAGVVHRDIKPGNVMVTTDGATKVLDFGLSRIQGLETEERAAAREPALDSAALGTPKSGGQGTLIWEIESPSGADPTLESSNDRSLHTQRGGLLGTLRYMSPEQARGELVTAASDMYALGLVLQELFTGAPAHEKHWTGPQVLERTRVAQSAPVAGLGRDLAALISNLKAPLAADRPTARDTVRRLRWIQDKPQRRMRRAVTAGVALVAVLGATKYTFDLRRERARAEGRTEAALQMMWTLFEQQVPVLAEVGRLDAFDAAAEGVQKYFAAMSREELTDRELVKLAKLLMLVGQVRESQGRPLEAQRSFQEALTMTSELERRLPEDSEVLLSLGAAHFYIGQLQLRSLNDPARALVSFRSYLAAAQRNEAVDPDRVNAVRELTYSRNAIVGALLELERTPEALAEQQSLVQDLRASSAANSSDPELRVLLADNLSWLGSARYEAAELELAAAAYGEELAIRRDSLAADPRNAVAREGLSFCLTFLAKTQIAAGQFDSAVRSSLEARDLLAERKASDPDDIEVAESLHLAMQAHGNALRAIGRLADAYREYAQALTLGVSLSARAAQSSTFRRGLIALTLDTADANLDSLQDFDEVEKLASQAHALVVAESGMSTLDRCLALLRIRDVRGRAKAGLGDPSGARAEWSEGLALLEAEPTLRRELKARSLEALLLARLKRREEAARIAAELPPRDAIVRAVLQLLDSP